MGTNPLERFAGRTLGVATAHGKERVIGPALMRVLPLAGFRAIEDIDTDRFGAFTGEVERTLDPLAACERKARHGAEVSGMDLVIASEGSFGPYPPSPFLSCDEEFLVLVDLRGGMVYSRKHVSLNTAFGGSSCTTIPEVLAFADRMGFPEQAMVLKDEQRWEPGHPLHKGLVVKEDLLRLARGIIASHGSCWVETDMRAMMNPTRMGVIAETAKLLAEDLGTACPKCRAPWFRITATRSGLPCAQCGWPTRSVRAYVRTCHACGYEGLEDRPDGRTAEEPLHCAICNP